VVTKDAKSLEQLAPSLIKMAGLEEVKFDQEKPANASGFVFSGHEFFVPLTESIDPEAERKRLEEELAYTRGFLATVDKKLSNERFVAGAPPAVVDIEKKKKADAEMKIKALEEQLKGLK
jgi:valyl-tRNA synthetase